ncbi:MAG: 1,4-alpha-glucan branching protein GlgB [Anaerolineae bacterium]|nr:1,4-alpha-glucan branching protein GlgB [Anaerolineae bacterium]
MMTDLNADTINALIYGDHGAPFEVLGPHQAGAKTVVVRALRPTARTLAIQVGQKPPADMTRLHDTGLFEITLPGSLEDFRYQLIEVDYNGSATTLDDPYAFPPVLSAFDIHLLGEGKHLRSYDCLGAHVREIDGVRGVHFAVWAPNARRISVVGHFNHWDARVHPMRQLGSSGIHEIFIPGLASGEIYKYDLRSHHLGYHAQKSDPYGFYAERRPNTASIVFDLEGYTWQDSTWMAQRAQQNPLTAPFSIYELHAGSWRRKADGTWLSYRELAHELVPYVRDMGYTHLELMPVAEHPFDGSWGYQVTGYYAPTSRYGNPHDFMYFVDYCHQHNIGVLLDWVPAHFPKDGFALSFFDGTHLYSHEDARRGEHPDWGTYIFNYGRNEVRNFLIANALFWLKVYHIDGLRVDAVSSMVYLDFSRKAGEWLPNQYGGNENLEAVSFLREMNEVVHQEAPGAITIAEESTAWPMVSRPTYVGGLGFTFKWNMGWMHDTLYYIKKDPVFRKWEHNKLTFSMMYAYTENFVLSLSHDEVVHLKGSLMTKAAGDWWQKLATMRLLYGYQYTHPGKKLNFMGQEIASWSEWSEARQLDWMLLELPTHHKFQHWVRDVNHFYLAQPALYEQDFDPAGFRWIEPNDAEQSVFSYIRFARDSSDFIVVVCNFTPIVREGYRIGVPQSGYYAEVMNSDSEYYGGSNTGNNGGVHSEPLSWHQYPQSLRLRLPPLSILLLRLSPQPPA